MSDTNETTPLTCMLRYYRQLSAPGFKTLTAHHQMAKEVAKRPGELSACFTSSVDHFARYNNPEQPFHERLVADPPPPPPPEVGKTIHFAAHVVAAGRCSVADHAELDFSYVDREPDCMRTSPGQNLEDGTPSKKAILTDLLLRNANDGTPIVAELKIRGDKDAFYGLVQGLAAAAHLVTRSQLLRVHTVYGYPPASADGPFLDIYVILFQHPTRGLRVATLEYSKKIRDALLDTPHVASLVRRIEFLRSDLADGELAFELA